MIPQKIYLLALTSALSFKLLALSPCPDMEEHKKYETPKPVERPAQPCYTPPPPPTKLVCHEEPECPPMEVLCDAGPRVCMGSDVFFTASFILWSVHQEGTEYAMSGVGTNPSKGKLHDVDYGLEPGFKVGLGYAAPHDGWDLYASYTWLHASADDRTGGTDTATLITDFNGQLQEARANWSLKFNVIDLELGRNFFASKFLKLRPFVGFKGTWQDQDYSVNYIGSNAIFASRNDRIDQSFWGFGMRAGMDTAWHFTNDWSIFGNFALSALWSGYDTDLTVTDTTIGVQDVDLNTDNSFHTVSPVLELMIGIRYETWFYHDEYHIAIDAGWEEQVWWGHNRYVVINQPQRNGGDLTFQGLTLTFRFDF
ncbi:MAG: outer membrane beta-barrel protein [Chlamydiales bacterium]|nr:outer membrane beta-barrel protein [Chlamydiales bacterium]